MNLSALPHRLALVSATIAFALVWLVGLASRVQLHTISFRAIVAAGIFWGVGYIAGRMFVHSVCDAITEQFYEKENEKKSAGGGER